MNKLSFNKIRLCAGSGYVQWLFSSKMLIYFAAMFFFYDYAALPLLNTADKVGTRLNLLEIFIAVGNSGMILLILPVLFIVLISGFPRLDGNSLFIVIRTGRLNWLIAQYLQLFYMAVTYLAALFLGTALPAVRQCGIFSGWSSVIPEYIRNSPEKRNSFVYELLPENLSNQLEFPKAFMYTVTLEFMYLMLIGSVMIIFGTLGKSKFGEAIAGGVVAAGTVLCAIKSKLMWSFPAANATLKLHFTQFLREPVFPLYRSYLYFSAAISVTMIAAFLLNKRNNYL